jgi:hypothetical protein
MLLHGATSQKTLNFRVNLVWLKWKISLSTSPWANPSFTCRLILNVFVDAENTCTRTTRIKTITELLIVETLLWPLIHHHGRDVRSLLTALHHTKQKSLKYYSFRITTCLWRQQFPGPSLLQYYLPLRVAATGIRRSVSRTDRDLTFCILRLTANPQVWFLSPPSLLLLSFTRK